MPRPPASLLSLGAYEEYAHRVRPGVAADHRPDVVDVDLLDAVAGLHLLGYGAGLHLAVGVADEHDLLTGLDAQLGDLVDEGLQAGLAAADLADGDQLALVGGMHDGLDGEHGAEERGAGAETAAHLQVVQVVHGEPVVDVELVVLHPLHQLLSGEALALLLDGQIEQQALAQRGGERVHHIDVGIGKLLLHVLGGDARTFDIGPMEEEYEEYEDSRDSVAEALICRQPEWGAWPPETDLRWRRRWWPARRRGSFRRNPRS